MIYRRYFIVLALLINGTVCYAKPPLQVSRVSVIPKTIDFSKNEKTSINYYLSDDAFVNITFKDENENVLYTKQLGKKTQGGQVFEWDGMDAENKAVTTDVVLFNINARTEDGRYAHFDPSAETAGRPLANFELTLDEETGKINYVLSHAARVRLRAGLKQGVFLNTLYDWQPQEAGRHELIWDGLDNSGEIDLLAHKGNNLNMNAYSLADNSIIMKGIEIKYQKPDSIFHPNLPGQHMHYRHPRIDCHEPRFSLDFPVQHGRDADGVPVFKGHVPVRVMIDEKDAARLGANPYEVMVYLDTQFLYEEEQALTPSTYYADVSNLNPGHHLLTVNVLTYDDHVGTQTVKFKVLNDANEPSF